MQESCVGIGRTLCLCRPVWYNTLYLYML